MNILKKIFRKIFNTVLNPLGYQIAKIDEPDCIIDGDRTFSKIYKQCKQYTMTPKTRMYALYLAVKYVIDFNIAGDFVECGVWRGGSMMVVAITLKELGVNNRKIYLYDTYSGMSQPTQLDYTIYDQEYALINWENNRKKDHNNWCFIPIAEVRRNMAKTGYPQNNLIFVKGKIEETIPKKIPKQIALLRLDTDWYESTKHELIYLYPLLSQNGVLIVDDYCSWAGSKKAVDEYFSDQPILIDLEGMLVKR